MILMVRTISALSSSIIFQYLLFEEFQAILVCQQILLISTDYTFGSRSSSWTTDVVVLDRCARVLLFCIASCIFPHIVLKFVDSCWFVKESWLCFWNLPMRIYLLSGFLWTFLGCLEQIFDTINLSIDLRQFWKIHIWMSKKSKLITYFLVD